MKRMLLKKNVGNVVIIICSLILLVIVCGLTIDGIIKSKKTNEKSKTIEMSEKKETKDENDGNVDEKSENDGNVDEKLENDVIVTYKDIEDLFGYKGLLEIKNYDGWCSNLYYAYITEETKVVFAESFGNPDSDFYVDIDKDGQKELVCNCIYGGDGARRVFIYRYNKQKGYVEVGQFDNELAQLENWFNWGSNSLIIQYDSSNNQLVVEYRTEGSTKNTIKYFNNEEILNVMSFEKYEYTID